MKILHKNLFLVTSKSKHSIVKRQIQSSNVARDNELYDDYEDVYETEFEGKTKFLKFLNKILKKLPH